MTIFRTCRLLATAAALAAASAMAAAQPTKTPAKQAYVVDLSTGTVLLDKDGAVPMPPASMSKLMTIYMAFDQIKKGALKLDDKLTVSERAWKKGGSKMFVRVGTQVSVADLLRGIIVQSGNDACIVVAEAIAGTEEAFAKLMTDRARQIGLTESTFANSTGWPDPTQRMSPRDLVRLSRILIEEFPDLYKIFAEKTFTYSKIKQGNRNPLLYREIGADGLKTGHTEESGYGLTASAIRDGRRIVLVVNGLDSVRARSEESMRLMEWAFRNFQPYALFRAGEEVTKADVWLGTQPSVPVVIEKDLRLTLSRTARPAMKVTVKMQNPVPAPIRKGQRIATLTVTAPETAPVEIPLLAGADVGQLGFVGRIGAAIRHVVWGSS